MRKTVQVCLLIVAAAAAVLILFDGISVTQTGTGNGGAICYDDSFASFCGELVANCDTDAQKVRVFREWVISNIAYDEDGEVLFYQTFDCNRVMEERKGVCFDYACILAAMCRSQGIPCFVLDGTYRTDASFRHAWNRVYFDGQWWSVDATRDRTARTEGGEEYGIRPIGGDPKAEDEFFKINQMF